MKKILILFLIINPFTCKKVTPKPEIAKKISAEIHQNDFYSCTISIYEDGKLGKIYLANYPVKIILGNKTYSYTTDSKGEIFINIPEDIAKNLKEISIYAGNRIVNLKYSAPVIKEDLKVSLNFLNYYHFILNINKLILRSKWPPGNSEYLEEYIPLSKEIEANFNSFTKKVILKSGNAKICLTKDEANTFWENPIVNIVIDNQKYAYNFIDFKPDESFFFLYKEIGTNYFTAKIQNRSLESIEAEITAGYKENDKWLSNNYLSVDYYNSQVIRFDPGEIKDVSIYYKAPNTLAQKDVAIKIIRKIDFLNSCE
ncbi:MAG: hypothetical protein QW041_03605 [Candidatus Pacearchaeota archaeon]